MATLCHSFSIFVLTLVLFLMKFVSVVFLGFFDSRLSILDFFSKLFIKTSFCNFGAIFSSFELSYFLKPVREQLIYCFTWLFAAEYFQHFPSDSTCLRPTHLHASSSAYIFHKFFYGMFRQDNELSLSLPFSNIFILKTEKKAAWQCRVLNRPTMLSLYFPIPFV